MGSLAAEIGAIGEAAAIAFLRKQGFVIRDHNWRSGRYELDIVAERWGVIHFVEVKSRKAGGWNIPEEAITPQKARALSRAAAAYLGIYCQRCEHQIDLVAIDMEEDRVVELRYIENAVLSSW